MFCILKRKKIYPTYILKHNSNREKQVTIFVAFTEIVKGDKIEMLH